MNIETKTMQTNLYTAFSYAQLDIASSLTSQQKQE